MNKQPKTAFHSALLLGIALCTIGFILTITIILAPIGLPIMMLGAFIFIASIVIKIVSMILNFILNLYGAWGK